jgi:predicted glycosyltransferase
MEATGVEATDGPFANGSALVLTDGVMGAADVADVADVAAFLISRVDTVVADTVVAVAEGTDIVAVSGGGDVFDGGADELTAALVVLVVQPGPPKRLLVLGPGFPLPVTETSRCSSG